MNKYNEIINYFGINNQQRKLQEEVFEFQEAVTLFENGYRNIEDVIEEMADILTILTEFIAEYEIEKKDIDKIMDYKLERTLERIKCGYYK